MFVYAFVYAARYDGGMTIEEAVAVLDAISGSDPEVAHMEADDVLFELAPVEVRDAYARLTSRCRWWAHA